MLCQFRVHSPSGAQDSVSKPNQLTPVRRTSRPLASRSLEPAALSGLGDPPALPVSCGLPAVPGKEAQATMPTNRGATPIRRNSDENATRRHHPVPPTRVILLLLVPS